MASSASPAWAFETSEDDDDEDDDGENDNNACTDSSSDPRYGQRQPATSLRNYRPICCHRSPRGFTWFQKKTQILSNILRGHISHADCKILFQNVKAAEKYSTVACYNNRGINVNFPS